MPLTPKALSLLATSAPRAGSSGGLATRKGYRPRIAGPPVGSDAPHGWTSVRSPVSHSPDAEDFVVAEWRAALNDAGVAEADYHLITCPGAAVTGHAKAVSFDPGLVLYGDEDEGGVVVQPPKIAEANANENVWRHRIAVLEDIDPDDVEELAFLSAVLRHEIEHAKQRTISREAFGLYELVDDVVRLVAVGDASRYRELINASPIEADANAAASTFVRSRHPQAVAGLLAGPDKYLVVPTGQPGDATTLVERTVDFLWQFREVCDDPKRLPEGRTFADILDNRVPGGKAGSRWRELESQDTEAG